MYSSNLYIGITTSGSFALSICILFIMLLQLVNNAQFLNITSFFLSSGCLPAASPASAVSWIALFCNSFKWISSRLFGRLNNFLTILNFFLIFFTNAFAHAFRKRQLSRTFCKYLIYWLNWMKWLIFTDDWCYTLINNYSDFYLTFFL